VNADAKFRTRHHSLSICTQIRDQPKQGEDTL
jgi:hypothetical protein